MLNSITFGRNNNFYFDKQHRLHVTGLVVEGDKNKPLMSVISDTNGGALVSVFGGKTTFFNKEGNPTTVITNNQKGEGVVQAFDGQYKNPVEPIGTLDYSG